MSCLCIFRLELEKNIVIFEIGTLFYQKIFIWVFLGQNFKKLLSYLKSTPWNLKIVKNEFLTHIVNFRIGSAFTEGPGSTFSQGPGLLYEVCHLTEHKFNAQYQSIREFHLNHFETTFTYFHYMLSSRSYKNIYK